MYYFSLLPLIMHCIGSVVRADHTFNTVTNGVILQKCICFVSVSWKPQEFWLLWMIQDFKILKVKAALTQLLARWCVQKSDYPVVYYESLHQ